MQNEKFWLVNIYAWGQNTYKINKGTRDNENVAKKIICICDLIFLLKIFQSNANFLKENHIPRAL